MHAMTRKEMLEWAGHAWSKIIHPHKHKTKEEIYREALEKILEISKNNSGENIQEICEKVLENNSENI